MKLTDFLDAKPLYYDVIDYDRMPRTYAALKERLKLPKIIHVVGTNGKGTTGRFMAEALRRAGYRAGHYTSPHILRFNERIWIDGADVTDAALEMAHETLMEVLDRDAAEGLSYFEYTTLLCILVCGGCDWLVLEAGLGGEHDATAVFPKELSVFTPIDFDHQAFLGESIESIAATKLRSMQTRALIGLQPHGEVYEVFDRIVAQKGAQGARIQEILDDADTILSQEAARKAQLPLYLEQNLRLAAGGLKMVGVPFDWEYAASARLFGRLSPVAPNVLLDVGHNPLAAVAIARALEGARRVLVYNSYKDKDYAAILKILRPVIKRVEIIDVAEARIAPRRELESALDALGLSHAPFEGITEEEEYLVFGSFSVAEAFLRGYRA